MANHKFFRFEFEDGTVWETVKSKGMWRRIRKFEKNNASRLCAFKRINPIQMFRAFVLICLMLNVLPAFASTSISKGQAVDAIIGEAEGECQLGKLAVACAIRNRGTLKGVYGKTAPRVKNHSYSSKTFVNAVRAWEESANPDNCAFIEGADHWEGTKFSKPYWATNKKVTAVIGNQRFYK